MKVICFIPIYGYHIFSCDGGDSNKKWPLKINKMTEGCNEKLMDVASFGHKSHEFSYFRSRGTLVSMHLLKSTRCTDLE